MDDPPEDGHVPASLGKAGEGAFAAAGYHRHRLAQSESARCSGVVAGGLISRRILLQGRSI
jgi:hypothetical protein